MEMTRTTVISRSIAGIAVAAVVAASCGGGIDSNESVNGASAIDTAGNEEFGEALDDALGGGGGGTLIFDGEEIPIASVTCLLDEDTFDVGTVSDNGYRVLVSLSNPLNDVSAQVLDADSVQWFPQGVIGDDAQRDGGTFSSDSTPYFNNNDDRIVEASFLIECP